MDKFVLYLLILVIIVLILLIGNAGSTESFQIAGGQDSCELPWVLTDRGCELTCPKGYLEENSDAICPSILSGQFMPQTNNACPEGSRIVKLTGNRERCVQIRRECPPEYKLINSGPDSGTCVIECPEDYTQEHIVWKGQEGAVCRPKLSKDKAVAVAVEAPIRQAVIVPPPAPIPEPVIKKAISKMTNGTMMGTDILGYDMPAMPIRDVTLADCHKKCMDTPQCHALTYRESDKGCWLKTGLINQNAFTVGNSVRQDTVDFANFSLPNMPVRNVKSADECNKLCDTNSDCQWATFDKTANLCFLKQGIQQDGLVSQFKSAWPEAGSANNTSDDFVCTPKVSRMTNGTIANTDIPGFDLPNMPIQGIDIAECNKKCKDSQHCHWINYRDSDKNCWLKTGVMNQTAATVGNGVQLQGVDIPGFDIANMPIKSVGNAEECSKLCQMNPECQWVTFNSADKNCWLKKGNKNAGITTQFKQCTIL